MVCLCIQGQNGTFDMKHQQPKARKVLTITTISTGVNGVDCFGQISRPEKIVFCLAKLPLNFQRWIIQFLLPAKSCQICHPQTCHVPFDRQMYFTKGQSVYGGHVSLGLQLFACFFYWFHRKLCLQDSHRPQSLVYKGYQDPLQ